jgi:hypothetical protein
MLYLWGLRIIFNMALVMLAGFAQGTPQQKAFDRPAFYAAMASSNMDEIDAQLTIVKGSSVPEKEAYEGALMMKKSGMLTKAKDKLSLFKAGRSKLEVSITKDKENAELRFLRVIIQEHAPKIVNYRNELEKDSQLIRANYKNLPQVVQQAITDYSKKSSVLKPSYF